MINDSDEEVIYGSDEESRRPLTSHHRITVDEDIWIINLKYFAYLNVNFSCYKILKQIRMYGSFYLTPNNTPFW